MTSAARGAPGSGALAPTFMGKNTISRRRRAERPSIPLGTSERLTPEDARSIPEGSRCVEVRLHATPFRSLVGDVRIARERMYGYALRLDAATMRGTARGSIGFDETLEYRGVGEFLLGSSDALLLRPGCRCA